MLVDIGLPDITGYQVTQLIRELKNGKKTPLVALTAHAKEEVESRCLDAGMDGVITKPLTHETAVDLLTAFVVS